MSRAVTPERREAHRREAAERRARQKNTPEYRARWRAKHGLILGLRPSIWANLEFRDCGHRTPCLIWTAATSDKGYGVTSISGRQFYVHRLTWEAVNGPMPRKANGKRVVTDHLCRVHACANPDHLEPVTDAINVLRGESFAAVNAAKTRCDSGHEFTPANTRIEPDGSRTCLECKAERSRKATAAQTAARRAAVPPKPRKQPRPLAPCGTLSARCRHIRRGEPIDQACRDAHAERMRQFRAERKEGS